MFNMSVKKIFKNKKNQRTITGKSFELFFKILLKFYYVNSARVKSLYFVRAMPFLIFILIFIAHINVVYAEDCNNMLCLFLHPSKESFLSYLDARNLPPLLIFIVAIVVLLIFGYLIYLNWRLKRTYRYY